MSMRGLTVRSLNGGGDEKRERVCVCVVKSSVKGRGGDVKVKYINHSLV